ncbi:MAG: hypothetical protein EOR12_27075 [Mesorhizobium sp.]|uniref:DUF2460 domain-containing protein n=1 Tax=Mesorhizobium sp. TaxID=1871066 RepID=UPI000FEA9A7D|nr:DUF2460 domain-containing protein [Mesorhizobium sp.]RWP84897.1 MAG: hypothetical protein EOR12_27075 [Mesorhizobium sp.]
MVDNVIMPESVSVGFKGGPRFITLKVKSDNERITRLQKTVIARHYYSWSQQNRDAALIGVLRNFFYDRRGDFKVFLMKDHTDFQCVACQIGIGDGAQAAFQATKTYTAGSNPYVRIIRHIKAGTLVVKVDGVTKTLTTHYTVSATGLITFTGGNIPAEGAVIMIDCDFYVPVAFEGDAFEPSIPYSLPEVMSIDNLQAVEDIP